MRGRGDECVSDCCRLPLQARKSILRIHTRQWTEPPSEDLVVELAERCVGYCGADLKALCAEAALAALRRRQVRGGLAGLQGV